MNRKIPLYGLLTALTVAVSLIVVIPIPGTNGFVTLCDTGIYLAALLFGPTGGLAVGALSGGLVDFLSGYPQWMFFSIVIHGLQGWLAGRFFKKKGFKIYIGLVLGCVVMVIGYGLATALLYGPAAGAVSIPSNIAQSVFGGVTAVPLSKMIQRAVFRKEGQKNDDK